MAVFGAVGAVTGASRQIANAAALVAAFFCARPLGAVLGPKVAKLFGLPLLFGTLAATLVAFILLLIAVRHVLATLLRRWMTGRDEERRSTDRWLGFFLGAFKVAAIAYVMLSGLVFVEDTLQRGGMRVGISAKDSVALGLAKRFNVFEWLQFRPVEHLVTLARASANPEQLHRLEADPAYRALRADPRFRKALGDRAMRQALQSGDIRALLRSDSVMELIGDRDAVARLEAAAAKAE